jgi:hypothetical protein
LFPSGLRTRTPPTRFSEGIDFRKVQVMQQQVLYSECSAVIVRWRDYKAGHCHLLMNIFFNGGVGNDRVKRVGFFLVGRTKREDLSPSKRFSRVFPAFVFLDGFNGLS